VALQPLGAAADVNELQRRAGLFGAMNVFTTLDYRAAVEQELVREK
jgi:hypothetical protein